MFHDIGVHVLKRAVQGTNLFTTTVDEPEIYVELPSWSILVIIADILVLFPLIVLTEYTFKQLYPIFAIVEDENPPAYEPVALDEQNALDDESAAPVRISGNKPTRGRPETVTSSVRAINRLLRSVGGIKSNFRGIGCLIAQGFLTNLLVIIFTAALGGAYTPIATLLASLALIQYNTAWVHIVISQPSEKPFWRRLPPFKRTFDATYKAVGMYWAVCEIKRWIPIMAAWALDLQVPDFQIGAPSEFPEPQAGDAWKALVIMVVSILTSVFLLIPAHVILVRVQSSLLPVDEDAIIPFDRSFQGTVTPAVVGGQGYVSMSDAWSTFSGAAWRRLVRLYVKLFAIMFAITCLVLAVIIPEFFLLAQRQSRDGEL